MIGLLSLEKLVLLCILTVYDIVSSIKSDKKKELLCIELYKSR